MSMGEIIIILIVAVLVLGPEKLPSTLVQVAKVLKALKRQVDEARESIEKEVCLSEIKKEADKYKNEFSEYNENIRKKLSFEEFDELKNSVNKGVEGIKDSLKFGGNSSENSAKSSGNLVENSVNSSENSAGGLKSSENSAENSANAANSTNENADFSTPNGKISRAKAQMLGLDILENSSEYGADFGSGEKSSAQTTSQCCEPGVNSIADDSEIIAKNSKTKATKGENSVQNSSPSRSAGFALNETYDSSIQLTSAKMGLEKAEKIAKRAPAGDFTSETHLSQNSGKIIAKNSKTKATNSQISTPKTQKTAAANSANSAQNPRPKTAQVKIKKSPKAEKPNV